ncbi:MAG: hypothetical protein ACE5IP_01110 [Terriglobia bacterium]
MSLLIAASQRLEIPVLGVIIPALIFLVSFLLTYWLYRRFSRSVSGQQDRASGSDAQQSGSSGEEVRR